MTDFTAAERRHAERVWPQRDHEWGAEYTARLMRNLAATRALADMEPAERDATTDLVETLVAFGIASTDSLWTDEQSVMPDGSWDGRENPYSE